MAQYVNLIFKKFYPSNSVSIILEIQKYLDLCIEKNHGNIQPDGQKWTSKMDYF